MTVRKVQERRVDRRTSEYTDEIFYSNVVATVVDFNIAAVHVYFSFRVKEDLARKRVSCVASMVISQHKNDVTVWYAQTVRC